VTPALVVPPATREKLASPAPPGQRHAEIVKIASALVAQGFNSDAIFHQIRPNYAPDVSDNEIRAVISWAENHFGGIRPDSLCYYPHFDRRQKTFSPPKISETPVSVIERYLAGFSCEEVDLWEKSPIRLEWGFPKDAVNLVTALYRPDENVNIVTDYSVSGGKGHPYGRGQTKKKEEWITLFDENGPPPGKMGVWIRPNPTDGKGISDANITAFRFLLVEFDAISVTLQLPFLSRLPLPISAIITSGGKSLHAWVRIDANNPADYRSLSNEIFDVLDPFGVDSANKNPSRLSRLPGVIRQMGSYEDNRQRLLYLNPGPKFGRIFQ
jgi:hypothetical protein